MQLPKRMQVLLPLKNGTAQSGNKINPLLLMGCRKGFTLIEALFSMLILSVGLLTVAGMQITAIKGNSYASRITLATAVIEEKLDEYKSMTYANITDENGTKDNLAWVTTVEADTPANDLKTITVTVSWEGGKRTHSLSFGTIVADN